MLYNESYTNREKEIKMRLATLETKETTSGFVYRLRNLETNSIIELDVAETKNELLKKARKAAKQFNIKIVSKNYAG